MGSPERGFLVEIGRQSKSTGCLVCVHVEVSGLGEPRMMVTCTNRQLMGRQTWSEADTHIMSFSLSHTHMQSHLGVQLYHHLPWHSCALTGHPMLQHTVPHTQRGRQSHTGAWLQARGQPTPVPAHIAKHTRSHTLPHSTQAAHVLGLHPQQHTQSHTGWVDFTGTRVTLVQGLPNVQKHTQ